jgi:hypothetical protein
MCLISWIHHRGSKHAYSLMSVSSRKIHNSHTVPTVAVAYFNFIAGDLYGVYYRKERLVLYLDETLYERSKEPGKVPPFIREHP